MFEDVLNQLAGPDFDSNRISGGSRADFPLNANLKKVFGVSGNQKFAEVKLNPYTSDAVSSIIGKQKALAGGALGPQSIAGDKINEYKTRAIALGIGQGGRVDTKIQSQRSAFIKELIGAGIIKSGYGTSADQTKAIKKALGIASGGYVPNFAAAALQQAIAREKSAGLADSQIYVDQSAALKSPMNPMGLMVANRRDEPLGGFQGISRARKEGMNPKLYGAANGFVPNYALQAPIGQVSAVPGILKQDKADAFNAALDATAKQLKRNQITLSQAEQNIEIYAQTVGTSAKGQKILESEGKKLIQAYDAESKARKQKAEELRKQRNEGKNTSNPSKDVNKGFADTAGKIFLLQSALSFLQGAVGDTEDSFSKITNAFANASGNITSLALLGKEIQGINIEATGMKGALGKLVKGAGLAGVAIGVATEAYGFANFAIKEFSGENQKAALASAKLADASDKLSLKFESLSKTRQTELSTQASKILGSAGYEGFFNSIGNIFRSEKLGGGDIGADPEIRKSISQLLALGASTEEINKILKESKKTQQKGIGKEGIRTVEEDVTQKSDILAALEQASKGELGQGLNEKFLNFRNKLSSIDVSTPKGVQEARDKAKQIYGGTLNDQQNKLIDDEIKASQDLNKSKQDEQKTQNAINFGERLSLEIAKQRLDRVFALKKINEESLTSQEQTLQYELETLDLSNKQKILKESELKNLELERKKRLDILAATEEVVNKASQGGLSVNVGDLDKLTDFLKENLGNINDQGFSKQLQNTFKISEDQAENLINSLNEQKNTINETADAQKNLNKQQTDFKVRIDNANQSLQNQLSTFQRIAQTAQSIASLNVSFGNLDIGKTEAEISRLQALANNPNLTIGQKESVEKQVIALQKINNETKKRNELESFQAKQIELTSQIAEKRASLKKTQNPQTKKTLRGEINDLIRKTQEETNNYQNATLAIDANNLSLSIQEQQIGKVIGAYASLNNQLTTFRRGAGERIGAAMFEQLGATDINSLMQARIKQNVEADASGLNDKDRYKFVQEETRLRQIQFDLATAESATRRRELEYEKKYTQEIIDLKNQGASDQELTDARNRQILEQRSGSRGFEKGLDTIQDRINNYRSTLGEEIPNLFSSNLAQGLNDAISGAKSLKEALSDAATSFFQEITRRNISNLADLVTGGIGGFFTKKAAGGLITGGSGTKDDVPAMLMGGEYVMKKSAVNKYGKGFLDALNNGKMRGYATGGLVDPQTFPTQTGRGGFFTPGDYGQGAISGKNELLTFASQSFTGGQYDYMGGFGIGGATVGLEPESARLSAFGRENSPMFERVQQSKDEAFKVYLEGLQKEKEYAELLDQIAKNEKARKKQLQAAIISAVVSSAASYAGTSMKVGAANASAAGGSSFKGAFVGSGGQGGLFNISKGTGTELTAFAEFLQKNPQYKNAKSTTYNFSGGAYRASGGLISGGSNIRDDVPAMLTGGEFVLNNRATQRIGLQNLNKLNNGQSVGGEGASAEMTQALISKLDELIQATQNSSSENVVVNVSTSEVNGQNQETPAGAEKDLQKKIRQAVLDVISQEKRLGGSLEKSR